MILLVGLPGCGKSSMTRAIVKGIQPHSRIYIVDLFNAYDGKTVVRPPFPTASPGVPIVFRPPSPAWTEDCRKECLQFAAHANSLGGVFVADELQTFMPISGAPDKIPGPYARMMFQGRKYPQMGVIAATQRMTFVHPSFRTTVKVLFAFCQINPLDIKIAMEWLPVEYALKLRQLRNLQYFRMVYGAGQSPTIGAVVPTRRKK